MPGVQKAEKQHLHPSWYNVLRCNWALAKADDMQYMRYENIQDQLKKNRLFMLLRSTLKYNWKMKMNWHLEIMKESFPGLNLNAKAYVPCREKSLKHES